MGDSELKEVRFDIYCPTCKHWHNGKEIQYCDDCLEEFMREGTEKPLKWEGDTSSVSDTPTTLK